jgi:GH24 family phage-related lysozyme (muramidase)
VNFQSSALTLDEFQRDFTGYMARRSVQMGIAPPSAITDQSFDLRTQAGRLKKTQGGAAYDRVEDGVDETYRARRNSFISKEEGTVLTAYKDVLGFTTVGVGFNMDQPRGREMFAKALPNVDYDAVYNGKRSLTKDESMKLLDYSSAQAEQIVNQRFAGVELSEHQRTALVSLAYNNPSFLGPRLVDAVKRGDTDGVVHQLLYRSNRQRIGGIFARRYREASMFVGPVDSKSKLPDYREYMSTANERYGSERDVG